MMSSKELLLNSSMATLTQWTTNILSTTPGLLNNNKLINNLTYYNITNNNYNINANNLNLNDSLNNNQNNQHIINNNNNGSTSSNSSVSGSGNNGGNVNDISDAGMQMMDDETADFINNELVQIFFCILYATVFVLGVFGNVLVCYVVLRNRAMQTVTNIFITNLALSDILLCVLAVPFTPLYTFMGRWAFGTTLCHLVSFAQGCSIYISTLTLTSIAVDRYFVIIYPFHPRMKLSTCIAIIVSIWIISVLATLPYGMYMKVVIDVAGTLPISNVSSTTTSNSIDHAQHNYYNVATTVIQHTTQSTIIHATEIYNQLINNATKTTISTTSSTIIKKNNNSIPNNKDYAHAFWESQSDVKTYCEENWPSEQYRKVFGSVTTILQFVLPFVIISICYTWVSIKLNARARAKPGSKSSQREEADRDRKKRTNRMLISMVAVFGLSWLPLNVVNIFDDFYEKSNEWRFYTLLFFVAHSLAMSSTCYNPFLYAWLNDNFRKEFKHVLPCFNPSNNNVTQITRGFQRSERNNINGQRTKGGTTNQAIGSTGSMLSAGMVADIVDGHTHNGAMDNDDGNGITQESQVRVQRENVLIIPREPTYGYNNNNNNNNNHGHSSSMSLSSSPKDSSRRQVHIVLNDNCRSLQPHAGNFLAVKRDIEQNGSSTDEHTTDLNFSETPFISSDNTTGISLVESSSCIDSSDDRHGSGSVGVGGATTATAAARRPN